MPMKTQSKRPFARQQRSIIPIDNSPTRTVKRHMMSLPSTALPMKFSPTQSSDMIGSKPMPPELHRLLRVLPMRLRRRLHPQARSLRIPVLNPRQHELRRPTLTNLHRPTSQHHLYPHLLHHSPKKTAMHQKVPRKNRRHQSHSLLRSKQAGNLHHPRSKPLLHLPFMKMSRMVVPGSVTHESPLLLPLLRCHRHRIASRIEERKR